MEITATTGHIGVTTQVTTHISTGMRCEAHWIGDKADPVTATEEIGAATPAPTMAVDGETAGLVIAVVVMAAEMEVGNNFPGLLVWKAG